MACLLNTISALFSSQFIIYLIKHSSDWRSLETGLAYSYFRTWIYNHSVLAYRIKSAPLNKKRSWTYFILPVEWKILLLVMGLYTQTSRCGCYHDWHWCNYQCNFNYSLLEHLKHYRFIRTNTEPNITDGHNVSKLAPLSSFFQYNDAVEFPQSTNPSLKRFTSYLKQWPRGGIFPQMQSYQSWSGL